MIGPDCAILLPPYDAVYIEIPKVACTSLKVAFAQLLGIALEDEAGNPHVVEFPSPDPANSTDGCLFPGLFTFAFVRNPWDRLVSCYRDKIRGEVDGFTNFSVRPGVADCLARFDLFVAGMSFDEFVAAVATISDADADEHFRSQDTFLRTGAGAVGVDFVGRYEHLRSDFERVARSIGLPSIDLPRLQAARRRVSYVDYYTAETRDIVAGRYRVDIEAFGYEFGV